MPDVGSDRSLRRSLGLTEEEQLILAGSTHAGEEELLVSAYGRIIQTYPAAVLMLAPRHIERVDRVEAMLREAQFVVQRKSRIRENLSGPRVVILDTRGELARAYREAIVAYVGGTLVPVGGHNLLEPAVWGTPVMFGPYTDHCAEIATLLSEAGGGRRVMGVEDLVVSIEEWFRQPDKRNRAGQVAKQVVLDNQGALMRTVEQIEQCLSTAPSYSGHSVTTGVRPLVGSGWLPVVITFSAPTLMIVPLLIVRVVSGPPATPLSLTNLTVMPPPALELSITRALMLLLIEMLPAVVNLMLPFTVVGGS